MIKKIKNLILPFLFVGILPLQAQQTKVSNYTNNRYPLLQKPFVELPIGTIKPKGWLEEQMNRMATGMTGHMDSIYEKVMGQRNGWLGGDGDVWERGPYWIDGLLPLAYILDNKELKQKVQPWIEWTLASQKPNGYFGPDTDKGYEPGLQRDNARDWWPKMVVLKIMQQYYSATKDQRVIPFMTNYFKYQLEELPKNPLGKWTFWAEQRGGDNLMMVYWLYNITGDKFLLELGELLNSQNVNWTDVFTKDNHLYRQHSLHCVNLAQGFKQPTVYYQQSKDKENLEAAEKAMKTIRNTIGTPIGLWAGDELIRFGDPIYGSELCTAVEMMYSLETMLEITGNMQWADQLERIAYNALPTQISDDAQARQYYQQVNQIAVVNDYHNFSTPHEGTDNLFGTLTGYPCCSSNLHQGWPKFVQHLWYATVDNGVAALVYAPSEVKMQVANNILVNIKEETYYPFDETVSFSITYPDKKIKKAAFPFHLRVPEWCKKPIVNLNGQTIETDVTGERMIILNREWQQNDKITIEFPATISISHWFDGGAVVERGPLVYALKLNEKWEKKTFDSPKDQEQYGEWYYQVTTDSPWNFAFKHNQIHKDGIEKNFIVEKKKNIATYPWTSADAPITIRSKAYRLPGWTENRNSTGSIAYLVQHHDSPEPKEYDIELIPYGCSTLRITLFPVR